MVTDYQVAQLIHILAASVWIGGHIVIVLGYLPRFIATGDFRHLEQFESVYEKIGMPSLVIAAVTGLYMAVKLGWPEGAVASLVNLKIALLVATILLAVDARLRIIRRYRRGGSISTVDMAAHIIAVTLISILFAVVGWEIRY
ncbi:hypothetical protein APE_2447 [Aeropyrum pernix K1]|uniref:Copper resistance protein D domain-containing protein n=1 Tax=Aeropyrum pernix (strain ATCC 700893 / DSM 11879 / JCM 9820 / NBRC 100138 / K1) TaxID=272557 RepID=Q9Y938_AERPE|nr:CopD family protein [Aeropyrum pernix]BAA81462.1 hypothetical protein APE_2447 [Aeropyrum pernix K1]